MSEWHPKIKLLRVAGIMRADHAASVATLPLDTQEHIADLVTNKNPLTPPYNGKFVAVPQSKSASIKDRCAIPDSQTVKYLLASYLYYEEDFSPITDSEYDMLCLELDARFDEITHWAKHLIDRESLKAGSGYDLHGRVPGALIPQAKLWRQEIERTR